MKLCIKPKFIICTIMLFAMIFCVLAQPSYATMYNVPEPSQTETMESCIEENGEYYKITTPINEKSVIYVEGHTNVKTKRLCIRLQKRNPSANDVKYPVTVFVVPDKNGSFSIKIDTTKDNNKTPKVLDKKGTVATKECYGTRPGKSPVAAMTPGTYHLLITRATTTAEADLSKPSWYEGVLGGSDGYIYKEALLTVTKGNENNPKLFQYDDVIENNISVRTNPEFSPSNFLDPEIKDLKFVLKNPVSDAFEMLSTSQLNYIKKVSNSITSGADNDYEKLKKIYEYIAGHVYYDTYAYKRGKMQFANPYQNLYKLRNNVSSANSSNGKVATTCQGYSAMVISLARAQNIPARLVYGHHITQPSTIWADVSADKISTRSHWWVEAYVDNRWILIDPNAGTRSTWQRNSFSDSGTWDSRGITTYSYFDPTIELLSNNYSYNGIYYNGYNNTEAEAELLLSKGHEKLQLRSFLNTVSDNIMNGTRLNPDYSAYKISTWTNNKKNNFNINSNKRVSRISWNGEKLYGKLDVSDFSELEYLSIYNNKLKEITLANCPKLSTIKASYNNLTTFNCTSSKKISYLNLKGNKLTNVKFRYGTKQRTVSISTNTKKANFSMQYNASNKYKVSIYIKKVSGYKYLGIYNQSTGKRISTKTSYTFNPSSSSYVIKYKKN